MIIEQITHQPLEKVFQRYTQQYKLNDTFFTARGYPNAYHNKIAHGYNRDGTFKYNKDVTFVSMSYGQSAGAMISTPKDLIHWLTQLFSGKILKKQSLDELTTVISPNNVKYIDHNKLPISRLKQKALTEIGIGQALD